MLYEVITVQLALGRNFTKEEDTPNGPKAAILGYGLWQSRFGGDADVLGRTITLDRQSYSVVGILPARIQYPEQFQLWTPLALGETGGMFVKYGEFPIRTGPRKPQSGLKQRTYSLRLRNNFV